MIISDCRYRKKKARFTLCLLMKVHSITYANQSSQNLIKRLDLTTSLQEIQETEE